MSYIADDRVQQELKQLGTLAVTNTKKRNYTYIIIYIQELMAAYIIVDNGYLKIE